MMPDSPPAAEPLPGPRSGRRVSRLLSLGYGVGFAAFYYAAGSFGLILSFVQQDIRVIWPPTGVALVGIMLLGYRFWPAVAVGDLALSFAAGHPFMASLGISAGNTLEALGGALLLRRYVGPGNPLESVRGFYIFLVGAVLASPLISSTVGAASLALTGRLRWEMFGGLWGMWWLGDAISNLVIAPVLLSLAQRPWRQWTFARVLEWLLLMAVTISACLIIFANSFPIKGISYPFSFPIFPLAIWGAMRFSQFGAAFITFTVAAIALFGTVNGVGPFTRETFNDSLAVVQTYIAVVGSTMQLLAAAVSERRRAGESLAASEQLFRSLSSNASVGIVLTDLDGHLTYCNPEWEIIHAQSQWEFARWKDFLHSDDVAGVLTEWETARMEARGFSREYRVRRESGEIRWVSARFSPLRSADGSVTGFVGTIEDITRRKETADELRHGRDKLEQMQLEYQAILRSTPNGLCLMNPDWSISYANEGMGTLINPEGIPVRMRTLRLSFQLLFASDEVFRAYVSSASKSIRMNGSDRRELELVRLDGTRFWCDITLVRLDPAETASGYVATLVDVTQQKAAEREMRRSAVELRALSARLESAREEERKAIAREIHDELGQQLTGLKMGVSFLLRKMPDEPPQLRERAASMAEILDEIITTVQKIATELRPGMLDDLGLLEALHWLAQEFSRRSTISCRFRSSVESLEFDSQRQTAVFRIVQEALTNIARHAGASAAEITVARQGDSVLIRIYDNGIGIRQEQIRSPRSLGLTGMRERALLALAELTISSGEGGTTVTLRIPVHSPTLQEEIL